MIDTVPRGLRTSVFVANLTRMSTSPTQSFAFATMCERRPPMTTGTGSFSRRGPSLSTKCISRVPDGTSAFIVHPKISETRS